MGIGINTPDGILDLGSDANGAYFTVSGANGDLSLLSKKASGNIVINPQSNLLLGSATTDLVSIGRTDAPAPIYMHSNASLSAVVVNHRMGLGGINTPFATLEVGNGTAYFCY